MLELIILARLCTRIGEAARNKGRRAIGYQSLLILFWFGGEVGTAITAGVILALLGDEESEKYVFFTVYIAAILGAALGAWLVFRIVGSLPEPEADEPDEQFQ